MKTVNNFFLSVLSRGGSRASLIVFGLVFGSLFFLLTRPQGTSRQTSHCALCSSFKQTSLVLARDPQIKKSLLNFSQIKATPELPRHISFVFGTYGKSLRFESAIFEVFDSSGMSVCRYVAQESKLEDNSELTFHSKKACQSPSKPASATLSIVTENDSNIALWVKGPNSLAQLQANNARLIFAFESGPADHGFVPLGFSYSTTSSETVPVYKRLSFAWDVSSAWIFFAAFLFSLAFALIHLIVGSHMHFWKAVTTVGIGAFCITATFSIFILPFQAPDEPDHALTMANAMNSPRLTQELEALAKRTHLERIKFHTEEKLLTEDLKSVATMAWGSHVAATELNRSAISTHLWRAMAESFSNFSGAEAVLAMRLLQSFIFAVCAGWSFWILGSALGAAQLLAWLAIPTIPFFAMHISNYGPLVSLTLVFSASVTALVWGQKNPKVGFALGSSVGLLLATSRSLWAFTPAIAISFFLGLLTRTEKENFSQRIRYWAAVCLGLTLFWLCITPEFLQYTLGNLTSRLPVQLHEFVFKSTTTPVALPFLFVFAVVADQLLNKLAIVRSEAKKKTTQILVYAVILGIVFSYVLPFLKPQLFLPDIETPSKIPLPEYLKKSVVLAAGLFRFTAHDFYISRSFFGGFGWLEAPLPNWTTSLILLMGTGGLLIALSHIRKTADLASLARMALIVSGLLLCVTLSAKGNWDESVNLHGRYLIPFYIVVFSLCFSGYSFSPGPYASNSKLGKVVNSKSLLHLALYSCILLHIYSIWFIFDRYFG